MNEIIQNILNRRSVRVYSDEQIKQEDLNLILQAGIYAPSGCNTQPWHFTVVQNQEILKVLDEETKKVLLTCGDEKFENYAKNEKYSIFHHAPSAIIISGEKSALVPQTDCAAATENMMLAAESLGIGSCWIGLLTYLFKGAEGKKYTKMLEIPDGYEPYYAISLGYKKINNPKPLPRREGTVNYIK